MKKAQIQTNGGVMESIHGRSGESSHEKTESSWMLQEGQNQVELFKFGCQGAADRMFVLTCWTVITEWFTWNQVFVGAVEVYISEKIHIFQAQECTAFVDFFADIMFASQAYLINHCQPTAGLNQKSGGIFWHVLTPTGSAIVGVLLLLVKESLWL